MLTEEHVPRKLDGRGWTPIHDQEDAPGAECLDCALEDDLRGLYSEFGKGSKIPENYEEVEELKKKYHPKNIDHIDIENFVIPSTSVNRVKTMINNCQLQNKLMEDKMKWKTSIIKNS